MEQWFVTTKRADFKALAKQLHVSDVLVRLMRNRGMTTAEEMRQYLHGSLPDLYDPLLLKDVEKGVNLVKERILSGERMRIISDYDVDGVCANYILYEGLKRCGAEVDSVIPHRVKDGYGINETLIQNAYDAGIRTILTCDNGIAAGEPIARAGAMGMTAIVLDHHDIPFEEEDGKKHYKIPPAAAVINPKQEDCAYPEKNICGSVVVFKFIQVLYRTFGIPEEEAYKFLEFAALGTVCDVMPLLGENRIIAKEGLLRFASTSNLGLKALLAANHLTDKKLSAYHLGFILGPCINASGRLCTAKKALDLFLCEDRASCEAGAEELVALNAQRKEMTRLGEEAADEYLQSGGHLADKVLVVYLPEVHESIAGIIAGRVRENYNKPAFVITRSDDGLKGSGRSIEKYPMFDSLVKVSDCLTKFGGHPMAAGLSMEEDRLEEFCTRLNADADLTEEDFVKKVKIVVAVPFSYLSVPFIEELKLLEPFGTGNPSPLFAQKDLDILSVRSLGDTGRVLRMDLNYDGGYHMDAVYFGEGELFFKEMETACGVEEVRRVKNGLTHRVLMDCVYYPEIHEWRGQQSIQVVIKYYRFKNKIPSADERKKIRLIGLDLDSTTLTTDKKLSPHTREVLTACLAQGIQVVPSTGRVMAGIPDELKELAGMTYIMTSNGASVHSLKTGEEIYQNGIPWERALELFDLLESYDTFYDFYAQGHGYCEKRFYEQIPLYAGSPEIQDLVYRTRTEIDDMREWVRTHQVPLEKISMFFETQEQRDAALIELRRLEDVVPTYSLFNNIELNARTCNKGEALIGLGARLGITPEEIMACGDSGNDLEMIRRAGVGVAMENATKEIKEAADFITKTNDEDGVAYAIEYFCQLS